MITLDIAKVFNNGNSRAVRLPRHVLRGSLAGDELVMEVVGDKVILQPQKNPRAGWDAQFKRALSINPDTIVKDVWGLLGLDNSSSGLEQFDSDDWANLDAK